MPTDKINIEICECATIEEMKKCVAIQRRSFFASDLEISPARHLLVTKETGGFTLGAYVGDRVVGFVLSVFMLHEGKPALYSHMTAVDPEFQNHGIGAKLKWAQRERALAEGINFIKWTFQPVLPRNAHFNLDRLGAIIRTYRPNFYGTDSDSNTDVGEVGLESDRLFAEWILDSPKVVALSKGETWEETGEVKQKIEIPVDWSALVEVDVQSAIAEQRRIKAEFMSAFEKGYVARAFERSDSHPKFLLY